MARYAALVLALGLISIPFSLAQMKHPEMDQPSKGQAERGKPPGEHEGEAAPEGPWRITMEELHRLGGVPKGWRFRLPDGDPEEGRKVFIKLECYSCHTLKGERFPDVKREPGDVIVDLSGMGGGGTKEYLAESVISPNRVIILGEGHTGKDGLSIMPSYTEVLTVQELLDVVAYISVKGSAGGKMEKEHGRSPSQGHKTP